MEYSFCSFSRCIVSPELVGKWETGMEGITVRTQLENKQFQFTRNSAVVKLEFFSDNRVSGSIGSATFENVKFKKNRGNLERTKIAYIVKGRTIGKFFENDPLDEKEVELFFGTSCGLHY
ncbi:hypothetical protein OU798_18080 [Prolixibacteraceae bacterium Z1-6]|uniref:Uncharacterized protein n=1 Tax=Draconibacterium aestuarii TaxID=2998507 RepID=A0A9X3F851_9BACT|nr:hypothetical protein [Prolixibacteraceae bacterium Z1-6]